MSDALSRQERRAWVYLRVSLADAHAMRLVRAIHPTQALLAKRRGWCEERTLKKDLSGAITCNATKSYAATMRICTHMNPLSYLECAIETV